MSKDLTIRPFEAADRARVIALWRACDLVVPWNNPGRDIERKLRVSPELFLVGELNGKLVATCMAGYEGHRGWINYLAVSPELHRQGIAARMMQASEARLHQMGCPKINLQVRASNEGVIAFYRSIGYEIEDVVSMGKRLEEDEPYPGSEG
jgi:ribosomal protein S18 acetylase RimI-like enzyme